MKTGLGGPSHTRLKGDSLSRGAGEVVEERGSYEWVSMPSQIGAGTYRPRVLCPLSETRSRLDSGLEVRCRCVVSDSRCGGVCINRLLFDAVFDVISAWGFRHDAMSLENKVGQPWPKSTGAIFLRSVHMMMRS